MARGTFLRSGIIPSYNRPRVVLSVFKPSSDGSNYPAFACKVVYNILFYIHFQISAMDNDTFWGENKLYKLCSARVCSHQVGP